MPSHTPQSPNGDAHPTTEGMYFGAKPELFSLAKKLRAKQTKTEAILWRRLSNKQLAGFKFRRQHPLASWIADFYCHQVKYVIELDGEYHTKPEQIKLDKERDSALLKMGILVRRFKDEDILNNLDAIINIIQNDISTHDGHLL